MKPAPILIGLLFDFPQLDGGDFFEEATKIGVDEVARDRIDRDLRFLRHEARGLPAGTAHDVKQSFRLLDDAGVLAIIGPSISDNGIIVRDLADASGIPCINYTGGAMTRSDMMFQYQVGSLEEEPAVLAAHLLSQGHSRVAVIHDHSPVGRNYASWFEDACATIGLEISVNAAIAPLARDARHVVEQLMKGGPEALVYLGLGVAAQTVSLAVSEADWSIPVVANSALMFGYLQREWRVNWEGWTYVDSVSDQNTVRQTLRDRSPKSAAGPIGVAAYDIGRLLGEAIARSDHLTRQGVRDGLQTVKRLLAASGLEGTIMGFGEWDRAALKGEFLVLRQWRNGNSVELSR